MRPISPRTLYRLSSSSTSARPFILQISNLSTSSSGQHSHSFRRHDEEVRNVRVSVWWDFENCNLPAGVNVFKVAHAITAAIRANGIKGPIQITAFGDMLQLSRSNQEALSSTGVNLTHVPHGGKNSADRSLLVDLMYWVSQNPPPAHLFLISGDRDFASTLHRLRMNNYNVLLASPDNAPGVLCSAASIMWPWHAMLTGQNLTGKHFNQPPDGPYGSWYGHYKVPLEDPYSVIEQPAMSQTEKLSEPISDCKLPMTSSGSDSKPRSVRYAVMKQIRQILKSHPRGISISDLRMELGKCKLSIDKDFYGYKKFSRFLLSFPHIWKLQPLGDGNFLIHGGSPKSSEPDECDLGMSFDPVSDNGSQDLKLASQLDCGDRSINLSANTKFALPTSHEPKVEEPYRDLQQPLSDGKPLLFPSPENVNASVPIDEEVVEVAKAEDTERHFRPAVAQDSPSEVGYFKRIWRKWFGRRDNVSGPRSHDRDQEFCTSGDGTEKEGHETPVKQSISFDNSGKGKDKEKFVPLTSQVVDQAAPASSSSSHIDSVEDNKTVTSYEADANKSKTSPGLFAHIVNWCKFNRSIPCSDKSSDPNTESEELKLFAMDSFWGDMESFIYTPKGSFLVSESRTREQMALNLQKEGPLLLRSLSKADLLHLVDLLILEKKWVEECPSQTLPFKLTHRRDGKSSLDHSNGSNRLTSIFLNTSSKRHMQRSPEDREGKCRNIPHSGVSLPAIMKKPSDRSRNEIIADCQKLVHEILKEYPEGYNMGLFRKIFLDRYGYHLDLHMLGYQKLASLLQTLPGVKIESSHIVPPCKAPKMFDSDRETSVSGIQKHTTSHTIANSDSELSDASSKDDGSDSPWDELGPVANTSGKNEMEIASKRKTIGSTGFDYEPSLSDDSSDSEGETSPRSGSEGQGAASVNEEDSSLLQILDSWYSNKDGDSNKDKSENVNVMIDSTDISNVLGSSGVGTESDTYLRNRASKQRPQKSYSFVADSVGGSKDKLIDGILGSLKKTSEPRLES